MREVCEVGYCLKCGSNTRLYHWGEYYNFCECEDREELLTWKEHEAKRKEEEE